MLLRIIIILLSFSISVLLAIYFKDLLEFFVSKIGSGWVFSTIYIRLLVIIFFTIGLFITFQSIKKLKKLNIWKVFLISLIPGFGVSFITPIYEGEYGFIDSSESREIDIEGLKETTKGEFSIQEGFQIVAFFTSGCPHCMAVSQKLGINQEAGQKIPVNAFFPDNKEASDVFIENNKGQNFNYFNISDSAFLINAGNTYPSVFLIDGGGNVQNYWKGDRINYSTLDHLLDLE